MKNIGIIGYGNIGKRIHSLICQNYRSKPLIFDTRKKSVIIERIDKREEIIDQERTYIDECDIIFLSVKPNDIKNVCSYLKDNLKTNKTIVSVAAATPIFKIEEWLRHSKEHEPIHNIIRCMPNLPISCRSGSISWYFRNKWDQTLNLILDGPNFLWLTKESDIDKATIISGSHPAFLAQIFEYYVESGMELGLSRDESFKLIKDSFMGTSILFQEMSYTKIIDQISSKNGVTEVGIKYLKDKEIKKIINESILSCMDHLNKMNKKFD